MNQVISRWSQPNQVRAQKILSTYPEPRSAVMPLLYVASLEHEYASVDAMREVAELVGLTPARKWRFYAHLGGQFFGIARFLPTDGNTFKDSPSVERDDFAAAIARGPVH